MRFVIVCLTVIFILTGVLFAGSTGKISGTVTDSENGEPLPGVNVIVQGTDYGAATGPEGKYVIIGVPPGTYTMTASMIGYAEHRVEEVKVNVDLTTRINIKLQQTVISGETVTVTAENPMVKQDETSTSFRVSSDDIESMPVENVNDILNMQAGVVEGHFRGGRTGEVMYMVDGIPINDVYSGEAAFQVEKNSIEQLEVISGTFNAEYGQAMSGVVNIVTKEGAKKFSGQASAYVGDYISTHDNIFWNIDKFTPTRIRNLQLNFTGPLPLINGSYFLSARRYSTQGWIYGKRVFLPPDSSDFSSDNPENWYIESSGDSSWVPMNPEDRLTLQGKFSWQMTQNNKLQYMILSQNEAWQNYDHQFRLNPEGQYEHSGNRTQQMLTFTHIFSEGTFLDLKFTQFTNTHDQYVIDDPHSGGYVSPQLFEATSQNAFVSGGMRMWHFYRTTNTSVLKADLKSQVTGNHLIKTGVEAKFHTMDLEEFQLNVSRDTDWEPVIPDESEWNHNTYTKRPREYAYYIQDKMEFEDLIVNAGIRLDYFQPDGEILGNYTLPDSAKRIPVDDEWQVSPRIGIAFPITANGAIHVSYGHFFQIPNFRHLYVNPEFEVFPLQSTFDAPPQSALNIMGNADLEPQKTIIYEIGLKQGLTDNMSIDLTGYYKDIRNLLGTRIEYTIEGNKYARYINRDYGQVKGMTLAIDKRAPQGGVGFAFDYTFQIAQGNASDPLAVYHDNQTSPPVESEKQMVPLNWDQTHSLNVNTYYLTPGGFQVSLIGQFGSGLPYTPTRENVRVALENSARKPVTYRVDMMMYQDIQISGIKLTPFLRVYNLFDRLNEENVYTDTGRAGYTLDPYTNIRGVNTAQEYLRRPDFYGEPRRVQLGVEVSI